MSSQQQQIQRGEVIEFDNQQFVKITNGKFTLIARDFDDNSFPITFTIPSDNYFQNSTFEANSLFWLGVDELVSDDGMYLLDTRRCGCYRIVSGKRS